MSGEVVSMEAGRKRLAEALEAKERFKRRRVALGLSSAQEGTPEACNMPFERLPCCACDPGIGLTRPVCTCGGLPKWPGGIDDMEIGE